MRTLEVYWLGMREDMFQTFCTFTPYLSEDVLYELSLIYNHQRHQVMHEYILLFSVLIKIFCYY